MDVINKLRIKFIVIIVIILTVIFSVIFSVINIMSSQSTENQIRMRLQELVDHDGVYFPQNYPYRFKNMVYEENVLNNLMDMQEKPHEEDELENEFMMGRRDKFQFFSFKQPFETSSLRNYFSVKLDNNREITEILSPFPIHYTNDEIAELIQSMRHNSVVLCTGPAGSGKTFLAVAEALNQLLSGNVSRLVLTRPVVEAGENLGFLPGDFEQKISPYLKPLFDAIEYLLPRGMPEKLTEAGAIEIAPLAYMRGRTLNNSILILDEAQNTTREQMKLFLTRMGEGSKAFVTGDITQIDLPSRIPSGLIHATHVLQNIEGIKIMQMCGSDIVRNPLVRKIVQAYENDEEK